MGERIINFDINVKLGGCENSIINFADGVVFCNKNLRENEKEKNSEGAFDFLKEEEDFAQITTSDNTCDGTLNNKDFAQIIEVGKTADNTINNAADSTLNNNVKRAEVYVPQDSECALYFAIGNFTVILASKTGRIIGINGDLNSVKYESVSLEIPQNFIDGEIALSSEKKLSKGLLYAYDITAKVLFDEQKNILQIGDGLDCDLIVRIFKNVYVLLNGGKFSAFVIDGNLRI